jgi:hypothetical protein
MCINYKRRRKNAGAQRTRRMHKDCFAKTKKAKNTKSLGVAKAIANCKKSRVAWNALHGIRKIALRNLRNGALSGENFELCEVADQCIG